MLDRWSSYTVTIVWKLAWADSALIILGEWSSCRSGHVSWFDCTSLACLWEHATTKKLKDLGIALTLVDSIKSINEQHVCSGGRTE